MESFLESVPIADNMTRDLKYVAIPNLLQLYIKFFNETLPLRQPSHALTTELRQLPQQQRNTHQRLY